MKRALVLILVAASAIGCGTSYEEACEATCACTGCEIDACIEEVKTEGTPACESELDDLSDCIASEGGTCSDEQFTPSEKCVEPSVAYLQCRDETRE